MVKGLDVFREHFAGNAGSFVLIGGVATQLWFENAGIPARATKDIDMVFRIEAADEAFMRRVWDFVRAGKYAVKQRSDGRRELFRFANPTESAYPFMLEIFAGTPAALEVPGDQKIVPVPAGNDVSSLSAILVDENYYELITTNSRVVDGLPIATPGCLILLKARAWLDLSSRKAGGERIDSKNIKKHRDDVFKLSQLLAVSSTFETQERVWEDLGEFLDQFPPDSKAWDAVANSAASCGLDLPPAIDVLALLRGHFVVQTG